MATNWAITIGINQYQYLQPLRYATRDADAMRALFGQELGFQTPYHFTDTSAPFAQDYGPDQASRPTYTTLRRFLNRRFEQPFLGDGDNLWFFFAGHGVRHNQRDYLVPIDGDLSDPENSAIPIHYVTDRLRRSGADNVILLIDACRQAEQRSGLGIGEERQKGVVTLFSCSPQKASYEIEPLQQGAFTHVLLNSLRLRGEGNCATVERLYQRLRYYVPRLTTQYKNEAQVPYGVIEPPSKNHLILLPQQATLADVEALKKDALTAEVSGQGRLAKQLWVRVLAASPADPEAVEGITRLARAVDPEALGKQATAAKPEAGGSGQRRAEMRRADDEPGNKLPVSKPLASKPPLGKLPEQKAESPNRVPLPPPPLPSTKRTTIPQSSAPQQRLTTPTQRVGAERPPVQPLGFVAKSVPAFETLAARFSRRRMLQFLGVAGGAMGAAVVGKSLLPSSGKYSLSDLPNPPVSWQKIDFEVVKLTETGAIASRETQQTEMFQDAIGDVLLEMVSIPGGKFMMGSPVSEADRNDAEGPQHEVTVPAFSMGRYPVTQAQWRAVAKLPQVQRGLDEAPSRFEGEDLPVERVSWLDAEEFCLRLSQHTGREYRLPSEAQWEYACRAGTTTPFYFGDTLSSEVANYDANYTYGAGQKGQYRETTTVVGSFPANAFGLYDMHGNVWEWCLDHWHDTYEGAPTDGSAWLSVNKEARRLVRGGSWGNYPWLCRSAFRLNTSPDNANGFIGFRVSCAAPRALD